MAQNKKWIIVETTYSNDDLPGFSHREKMFVANVVYEPSGGFLDLKTANVYPYSFNNKNFNTEEEANKYLAKYFKGEMKALHEMTKSINKFSNKHTELMI